METLISAFAAMTESDEKAGSPSRLEKIFMQTSSKKKTFEGDKDLPSLPLPTLEHTLDRYLDSLKPFITPAEFEKNVRIVEEFKNGMGAELNEKLKEKAKNEKNWLEKLWEDYGYLQNRAPLLPYSNMVGVGQRMSGCSYGIEEDQIKNGALICYHMVNFCVLLRREELKPNESGGGKTTFSMSQFRRLFGAVRRPGATVDSLGVYFRTVDEGHCPSNVVVMCKGRLFNVNTVDDNGYTITPPEWEGKLREVLEKSKDVGDAQNIGILTCDTRTKWFKYRQHLIQASDRNRDILDQVEMCLFVLVLDEDSPESMDAVTNYNLIGDYNNRWADKSLSVVVYKNGFYGIISEHSAYDGITCITCLNYIYRSINDNQGVWVGTRPERILPPVEEIRFDLDQKLKKKIRKMAHVVQENKKVAIYRMQFKDFGKMEIQRMKMHPDSFVQMALQLAYYKLHKKPAPCYETATTRAFFNGRTETVRSCTVECIQWIKAMADNKITNEEKARLLVKAVKRHDELMGEARLNAGCDRHLFGLYCTALEEGIPIPELFNVPAYFASGGGGQFLLSTSCTGFTPMSGGVAPMRKDGYGVFYNIMLDEIDFVISVNTKSRETNYMSYFESIKKSMSEMRFVMLYLKKAKL